ncbi:hypothetical protein [Amycolatopsis jiangsuensis]|uniref:Phytoene synthase n=1 Tax=Amycolatopsis jiangsuensis TaxID=1181879 RepID=A0A840J4L8_9PSEU|nr:hypothetical protein [Amycolatopsis jiangsuensis]MBB4688565.1 hypothetical protein [Amycolatopsis jiangsuensis]
MASGVWRDVGALVRSAGLGVRPVPVWRSIRTYVAAFDQVVAPILRRTGGRQYLADAACEACVKLGLLLAAYAGMAGVPFRPDLAMLGGAVARVYDDLIDRAGPVDHGLDRRVAALFRGAEVTPRHDVERLLHGLYRELERRLGRDRDDPVHTALVALHEHQLRSRRQQDPAISAPLLVDITRAKGGHAMVVFCGLLHPALTERQVAVVRQLGAVLQLVDDYVDVAVDRQSGITTAATRRELTLVQLCREMRELRPRLRACYGRAQPLAAMLYLDLWRAFLQRRGAGWPARYRPFRILVRLARRRLRSSP